MKFIPTPPPTPKDLLGKSVGQSESSMVILTCLTHQNTCSVLATEEVLTCYDTSDVTGSCSVVAYLKTAVLFIARSMYVLVYLYRTLDLA